jgi:hypothetical protein
MHTVETDEPLFTFDRKELIAMVRELLSASKPAAPTDDYAERLELSKALCRIINNTGMAVWQVEAIERAAKMLAASPAAPAQSAQAPFIGMDREWTPEEKQGMNDALRQYGWTDAAAPSGAQDERVAKIRKVIKQGFQPSVTDCQTLLEVIDARAASPQPAEQSSEPVPPKTSMRCPRGGGSCSVESCLEEDACTIRRVGAQPVEQTERLTGDELQELARCFGVAGPTLGLKNLVGCAAGNINKTRLTDLMTTAHPASGDHA